MKKNDNFFPINKIKNLSHKRGKDWENVKAENLNLIKEAMGYYYIRFTSKSEFEKLKKQGKAIDYSIIVKHTLRIVTSSQFEELKKNNDCVDYVLVSEKNEIDLSKLKIYFNGEECYIDDKKGFADSFASIILKDYFNADKKDLKLDYTDDKEKLAARLISILFRRKNEELNEIPPISLNSEEIADLFTKNGVYAPEDPSEIYFNKEEISIIDKKMFKDQVRDDFHYVDKVVLRPTIAGIEHTLPKLTWRKKFALLKRAAEGGSKESAYFLGCLYSGKQLLYAHDKNALPVYLNPTFEYPRFWCSLDFYFLEYVRDCLKTESSNTLDEEKKKVLDVLDEDKALYFMQLGYQNGDSYCALWLGDYFAGKEDEASILDAIRCYTESALLLSDTFEVPYKKLNALFSSSNKKRNNKILCTIIDSLEEISKKYKDGWSFHKALDELEKLTENTLPDGIELKITNVLKKFPNRKEQKEQWKAELFFKEDKADRYKNVDKYIYHLYHDEMFHGAEHTMNGLKYLFLYPPVYFDEVKGSGKIIDALVTLLRKHETVCNEEEIKQLLLELQTRPDNSEEVMQKIQETLDDFEIHTNFRNHPF